MQLDPATLAASSAMISFVMGCLLVLSWLPSRANHALPLWGIAFCMFGVGMVLTGLLQSGPVSPSLSLGVANALVLGSVGLQYVGCRLFNERPTRPWIAAAGPAAWIAVWLAGPPPFEWRVAISSSMLGAYLLAAGWELVRHAPRPLISQRVAAFVYLMLSTIYLARGLLSLDFGFLWPEFFARRWSMTHAMIVFASVPVISVLLLSMTKERVERALRHAASTDPLTGIPNRRAFIENAEALLRSRQGTAAGCLILDLDDFKGVNDRHGHHVGDELLVRFARILHRELPGTPVGRLGGEEFGALLLGGEDETAAAAERIRAAFMETRVEAQGSEVGTTVSIGYSTAMGGNLAEMMLLADKAVYRAKAEGRNRVVGQR